MLRIFWSIMWLNLHQAFPYYLHVIAFLSSRVFIWLWMYWVGQKVHSSVRCYGKSRMNSLASQVFVKIGNSCIYHLYPVCILMTCLCKDVGQLKAFPQCLHSRSFSPVWILSWLLYELGRLKAFPQSLHLYGFSPVCILMWPRKVVR